MEAAFLHVSDGLKRMNNLYFAPWGFTKASNPLVRHNLSGLYSIGYTPAGTAHK
jgi:hypothetical protein